MIANKLLPISRRRPCELLAIYKVNIKVGGKPGFRLVENHKVCHPPIVCYVPQPRRVCHRSFEHSQICLGFVFHDIDRTVCFEAIFCYENPSKKRAHQKFSRGASGKSASKKRGNKNKNERKNLPHNAAKLKDYSLKLKEN